MFRKAVLLSIVFSLFQPARVFACDACACTFNARNQDLGREASGPMVTTPTANTFGKGHASAGFVFEHMRYNKIPAGDAHELHHDDREVHGKDHEEFYTFSLGYGVLDNLDIFISASVVSKTSIEIDSHARLGKKEAATGFGDLSIIGKYRFWQQGVDMALLLGVKAPTGYASDTKENGAKFEIEQQPGSGSWDLTTGLAMSRSFAKHASVASTFRYTTRGEGGQEHKRGDNFHYDLGLSYALKPLGEHPNLSFVLELRNEWARRDHSRHDDRVLDSGGITILLSPGLAADITENLAVFWSLPMPIYQDLGGEHEELAYSTIAGLSLHF